MIIIRMIIIMMMIMILMIMIIMIMIIMMIIIIRMMIIYSKITQLGLAALELFLAFLSFLAFPPPCPPPKRRPCRAFVPPTACRLTPALSDLQPAELCKSTFCIIGILHVDLL